jgi:opacity protein-like surface antigen
MRRLSVLIPLLALGLPAQRFSVGVKAGVPVTAMFHTSDTWSLERSFSKTKRYTVGPSIELRLPLKLAVEADILYTRLNYGAFVDTSSVSSGPRSFGQSTAASRWEFPILVKYRFPFLHLFVAAGPAFNHVTGVRSAFDTTGRDSNHVIQHSHGVANETPDLKHPTTAGFATGAGFEFGRRHLRFIPEARYTRWRSQSFVAVDSILTSKLDQVEILLGVMF